ncbi:hypothetical protein C8F04DRAFT_1184968 [Mycena alexandri]|uniref:Uncharacterized protein n=1 Tax=Mycena alexandri TaxID=1745969 RepID=A0AAD6X2L9_9AGAR|nr:hypothetical protein C8F04DRAFT_1184968 [Mycena alexandri]
MPQALVPDESVAACLSSVLTAGAAVPRNPQQKVPSSWSRIDAAGGGCKKEKILSMMGREMRDEVLMNRTHIFLVHKAAWSVMKLPLLYEHHLKPVCNFYIHFSASESGKRRWTTPAAGADSAIKSVGGARRRSHTHTLLLFVARIHNVPQDASGPRAR